MNPTTGKYLIFIGSALILIGIIIYFFADKFQWLGRLLGDIRYENSNTRIYFPVVTMLIISLLLNLIIYLVKKFL
jgi:uncharacterized membrane protein